jgi:hypothetical protein
MNARALSSREATAFREAISQWQLAARTEIKRASSLPSSMFDANDPMLEARLAETVAKMMRLLHRPSDEALSPGPAAPPMDIRVESVDPKELRSLPGQICSELASADLEDNVASEYFNMLIDTCTTGEEAVKRSARELLSEDFDVDCEQSLEAATATLRACMERGLEVGCADAEGDRRLEELCGAIAATILVDGEPAAARSSGEEPGQP